MQRLSANLLAVVRQSGVLLLDLLPYVIAGALLAALLLRRRDTILPSRLSKLPIPLLILMSALLGTISPLCTMGTVPVVIGMVGCGFPAAAGISFMASSSLVNPQLLFIAFSTIGPVLTAAQWLSGIGIGCASGFLALFFEKRGFFVINKSIEVPDVTHGKTGQKKRTGFVSHFLDQLEHVLIYVVAGVVAASAVNVYMPELLVMKLLGRANIFDAAAGAALSVPMYVCGGGVLPMLAALMNKGLSAGVVLAFIIAGPATRLQAIAAIGAFMSKKALVGYLVLILVWATAAGMAIGMIK